MNGAVSDAQTWVNLLNKEAAERKNTASSNGGGVGITISSQTPRIHKKSASTLHRNEKPGENEVLRSQVVNLLKEKQETMKKV